MTNFCFRFFLEKLDSFPSLLSFQILVTRHHSPRQLLVRPQRFTNTSLFLRNCPQDQRPEEPTRPSFGVKVSLPNFLTINTRILNVINPLIQAGVNAGMNADDGLACGGSVRAMERPPESRHIVLVAGRTVETDSREAVGLHCRHCWASIHVLVS
jgi:hypothetical protein